MTKQTKDFSIGRAFIPGIMAWAEVLDVKFSSDDDGNCFYNGNIVEPKRFHEARSLNGGAGIRRYLDEVVKHG